MKNFLFLLIIGIFITNSLKSQSKRLALVIGNENYVNSLPLYNPVNDANSMEIALKDAGFEVVKYIDLDKEALKSAIDNFGKKLSKYEVGLVFYAGHGIQSNGLNYLIPVDASLKRESDIVNECLDAQRILKLMELANISTNIVILDACRNSPFERSWTRSAAPEGLAFMNAPSGSIIAFSTSPGNTASDGDGKNGLYTSILTHYLRIPNLKIEEIFKRVRKTVREKSNGDQVPWENTSLEGDFYFLQDDEFEVSSKSKMDEQQKEDKIENTFYDMRDGQEYKWVKMGEQIWMAENLNFEMDNSWCYGNSARNCTVYGRLYMWETALKACPIGWRLPSDQDWKELELFIGMDKNAVNDKYDRGTNEADLLKAIGDEFWVETNDNIQDRYRFSILPAGDRSPDGTFDKIGKWAVLQTSTSYGKNSFWTRIIRYNDSKIYRVPNAQVVGASVRCIYDKKDDL